MKISLKKLEIHPRLSEETTAFDADVWIDGTKVGHATNNGRGGQTRVSWIVPQERRLKIEEVLKARVPAGYRVNGTTWAIDKIVTAAAKRAFSRGSSREVEGVSIRDAQEAASILGDARTEAIVGHGGLSGATEAALRRLVKEAIDTQVIRIAKERERQQAKKTPAQLDAEIAKSLSGREAAHETPSPTGAITRAERNRLEEIEFQKRLASIRASDGAEYDRLRQQALDESAKAVYQKYPDTLRSRS